MAAITPQVKGNTCIDPSRPLYPPIEIGSDFWFSWLREPELRSFHFESEQGKFTARKEERATSTNEYWYAYRKIGGKLRKVYLGAMDELSSGRLNQVAAEISQSGQDYYSRKSYIASKEQKSVPALKDSLTSATSGYTTNNNINCVTASSELEALRSQIEQLQSSEKDLLDQVCNLSADQFKAVDILNHALTLKANAGGAIKEKIREALRLVDNQKNGELED